MLKLGLHFVLVKSAATQQLEGHWFDPWAQASVWVFI